MSLRVGRTYLLRGRSGMSVEIPSSNLYVVVMDSPNSDDTVLVSFSIQALANISDLQEV